MSPKNGIYIVQGELNHIVAALRRNTRWTSGHFNQEEDEPLLQSFNQLKDTLQNTSDINDLDVNVFLGPFLEVIRSEETTGPMTGVALSAVNKFLSYGLLDPSCESASSGIDNLADAVTHARFVGTDPSSDEVVLMKILQVLRTLLLSPVGVHMTNEAVCEIMQSCFRICFEMRLSELLRRTAEQTLIDMVQLLFLRLPQFKEDLKGTMSEPHIRKMLRTGHLSRKGNRKQKQRTNSKVKKTSESPVAERKKKDSTDGAPESEVTSKSKQDAKNTEAPTLSTSRSISVEDSVDSTSMSDSDGKTLDQINPDIMKSIDESMDAIGVENSTSDGASTTDSLNIPENTQGGESDQENKTDGGVVAKNSDAALGDLKDHGVVSIHYPEEDDARSLDSLDTKPASVKKVATPNDPSEDVNSEYVNPQGVRFTPQEESKEGQANIVPYGLPCVRELLRFLSTLINPHDRHNTNAMVHIGLSLLTVALESGASHLGHFASLMTLIKDDLCRNIFALLQCDIHILFSLSMRVCFLLFEALRGCLKFQLERYIIKLSDILALDNLNVPYEKREMALEYMNQLFHIPCLVQEIYLNFDCDLHATNVLEDMCKILSKNAFRPGNLSSVNLLALDALLSIINEIESHCISPNDSKTRQERTLSNSSEVTADESGTDDTHEDIVTPATSGYDIGRKLLSLGLYGIDEEKMDGAQASKCFTSKQVPAPSAAEAAAKKKKKKALLIGIEEFNKKAKKGIEYLQENGLMSTPFLPEELVHFMKENPNVDKKVIGDYIGDKRNPKVLEAFVKSFELKDVRVDEALRCFLEAFRLPGEAPVISLILEEFALRYFENNQSPYENQDAVFTLAYAIIMLNVDQHNKNIKQQKPMQPEEFKRNLRKTNGSGDFPAELLQAIYENIKNNEIVMPSERSGKVKEAYEWKLLLRRAEGPDGIYIPVTSSIYDEELFLVLWGPTVAALSYIYENSVDKTNIQKTILGFRKCATISAFYNLSEVFDNLLQSLCKFTSLLVTGEASDNLPVLFGGNLKAQLSARTAFALAHKYGDILHEGWHNLLICLLQLLKGKMLPTSLTEVEDFVDGKVSIIKEEPKPVTKQDNSGMLSGILSYWTTSDTSSRSTLTAEDRKAQENAINCIKECRPESIITESKFLRGESLQELVKALIISSKPEHSYESTDVPYDAEASVFFLEFLIEIALQNRDRISLLWQPLREHLSNIIISAPKVSFLVERAVVGLLRLAIRLIRREDISAQILITLRILLMMHPKVLLSCSKQISYGLHELVRTNASDIHYSRDWITILTILQVVGAGANPPIVKPGPCLTLVSGDLYAQQGGQQQGAIQEERVDTETGEIYQTAEHIDRGAEAPNNTDETKKVDEQWLLINKNEDEDLPVNQFDLTFKEKLNKHDCKVFIKASSSIGFIVRDMAHVRDFNIFQCIYAVLLFGEASSNGGLKYKHEEKTISQIEQEKRQNPPPKRPTKKNSRRLASPNSDRRRQGGSQADQPRSEDEIEFDENTSNIYDAISLQLLDLMYALHTKASKILGNMNWLDYSEKQTAEIKMRWSSKESLDQLPSTFRGDVDDEMSLLWVKCWCPLLQGIARLACDIRRDIRMNALTVLQRSLLAEDLHKLAASEWENCFNQVLFPMLASLLEIPGELDPTGIEETRMRAATLLCKAFLQHLNTLVSLATFTALWMTILDFMDRYMHADKSDLLFEAIPESLKNMLLVMSTAGIFEQPCADGEDGVPSSAAEQEKHRKYSALWQVTWERIDCFLPNLRNDLVATQSPVSIRAISPPEPDIPLGMTMHTTDENQGVQEQEDGHVSPVPVQESVTERPPSPEPPTQSMSDFQSITPSTPQRSAGTSPLMSPERAASPLLADDPLSHLNIKLHAPLPVLSPPGSVQPIHETQPAHPVPILLPSFNSLQTLGSPRQSENSLTTSATEGQGASLDTSSSAEKSTIYDI
uniref:SEC7 domain-containing protein n=1 Tax=Clytia hemisphaerica TaxID=252671 RepID=A0A7M5X4G9_9CNID